MDTSFGLLSFNANDHYSAGYPLSPDNSISTPAHNLVDASLTGTAPSKHFDVLPFTYFDVVPGSGSRTL